MKGKATSSKGTQTTPPDKGAAGVSTGSGPLSEDRARQLVAALPEVRGFAAEVKAQGRSVHIDVSPVDAKTFIVHVYEIVDDGKGIGHTATFDWYKVDRVSGKISSGMTTRPSAESSP